MYLFLFLDSEVVKPVIDLTIRVLKSYETKILSVELDRLLQEVSELNKNFT